ncbi:hypothetical protein HUE46_09490 [Flavobacterium columnare]|uniref:hypothetical protein n=1 Tax=Flavobacterium columnare TaxID=996 RepID=UPI00177E2F36|nr:hypothetical protein [Flavobacterium columnare]QOG90228.1 hypothetical protein HUE41_09490 [Flavobacterium columnare]QOG92884.1 hypothetical protein HUE42_09485 [Flavobacterium columnare]QOG95549.1 hypothetical protein HUE43_09490 [Flavobacterium columnare]QOG98209.1 hypothetical protein HUE44_09485 [Flavobacterium columnare]QOH00868.1 hypothetical protein HUE45_09485 [Flavobacterium columnare]
MIKKKFFLLIIFLVTSLGFAQKKIAGIEFNNKEIKVLVIESKPDATAEFKLKSFWSDPIVVDPKEDRSSLIKKIIAGITTNVQKIKLEQNVESDKLFLISDVNLFSEVEMVNIQKELSLKNISKIDFLNNKKSCQYIFEGLLKNEDKDEATLIHINANETVFCSYTKKEGFKVTVIPNSDFQKLAFLNDDSKKTEILKLNENIKQLYYYNDEMRDKKNIYLSGELAWASYALFNGGTIEQEFNPLKIEDLENHQISLDKKFDRYQVLASANIEADKVLTYYSKYELSIGNKFLTFILKNLEENSKKKILYCKNTNKVKLVNYLTKKLTN